MEIIKKPEKTIYHVIQVNKKLLKHRENDIIDFKPYLIDDITDTLPKGKLIGIHFNSYVKKLDTWSAIDYQGKDKTPAADDTSIPELKAFICSHTQIRIENGNDKLVTKPCDLRDFERKNWSEKGFKEVEMNLNNNEQIKIRWETIGDDFPPVGEFVFTIKASDECAI
ncbi:hypothetical protein [Tenacibaculum finnmarkense]|uniref:hypothetical protein n=1 Tax=Tenacibaculum finnmarkense TaxID=2781243 RepID=UPI003BB4F21C